MADALTVTRHEAGTVRVFAVNLDDEEARGLGHDAERLRLALGAEAVDPAGTELVRVADLQPLGLAGYLADGYGIEDGELAEDRNRLDSLGGHVLLVRPSAFAGTEQTLTPGADLRLIGRYTEPAPAPAVDDLPDRSARGTAAPVASAPARATPAARSRWLTGIVLLIGAVVVVTVLMALF